MVLSWDMTFCSKENCKNKYCVRNLKHGRNTLLQDRLYYSVGDFPNCDFFKSNQKEHKKWRK